MRNILLIRGPMACGKTTTINNLIPHVKDYNFIDRQYIKSVMLRPLDKDTRREISKKVLYFMLKEVLTTEANIILQETSVSILQKHLGELLDTHKYQIIPFYVTCSVETALVRDEERSKQSRPDEVRRVHESMQPEEGDYIINTEEHSPEEVVQIILEELKRRTS